MRTTALQYCDERQAPMVTVELDDFELVTLAALVEEGHKALRANPEPGEVHARMTAIAGEFMTLLGHLELMPANG